MGVGTISFIRYAGTVSSAAIYILVHVVQFLAHFAQIVVHGLIIADAVVWVRTHLRNPFE